MIHCENLELTKQNQIKTFVIPSFTFSMTNSMIAKWIYTARNIKLDLGPAELADFNSQKC